MARNGIVASILLFSFQPVSADNVELGTPVLAQPDGTRFSVREHADEFGHYLWADAGYVIQNPSTGYYYYSRYDIVGDKAPTSLRVGRDDESSDTRRLAHVNSVVLETIARRAHLGSEIGEGEHPGLALCANGIAVPEPQDNLGLVQDCAVLLAVRDSLGLTAWSWSADIPIRDWRGVTVSNARVTELYVSSRLLTGTISPRLAQLSELKELHLIANTLTGPIPPELGELIHLERLSLSGNALTGTIPPEWGQLTQLRTLDLAFNKLTGEIPPELAQLSELRELALGYNALTGEIPPEVGQLINLEFFI